MDHETPTKLIKMKSGYAQMGNIQFLPGYCVLGADPQVRDLTDLNLQQRTDFLLDMSLLGDAIMTVCKPLRMNYGILGNSYPFLHAHLFPRYDWEPEELRKVNVWRYPESYWGPENAFDKNKHGAMQEQLIEVLKKLTEQAYA